MAKLGDICKFQSGGTPSKTNESFFGGSIPWITTVSLNDSLIDEKNAVDWITEEAINKSAAKIVPKQSIMIGTRVGIGKTAINRIEMSTSQDIIALLDIDELKWDKHFLCLFLLSRRDYLISQSRGATIKGIKIDTIANIDLPDYSLYTQRKIAANLDKVTHTIDLCNAILEKLDLLVKSRFIELFGDPVSNPMKWDTKTLLSIGKCKNGMNFHYDDSGIEIHCLGVGDFKDLSVIADTTILPKISLNEMPSDEYLLQNDDIVFVRSNGNKALVGRSLAIYPNDTPTTFSGFCIRFRKDDDSIIVPYLLRVLKTDSIRKKMAGRGANIQNLNQQILSTLEIPIPPLELQEQFAAFVEQTDKSKLAVKQVLQKAETLKKALMQKYFG